MTIAMRLAVFAMASLALCEGARSEPAMVGAIMVGGAAPKVAGAALAKPVFVIRHLQKAAGDDPQLTAEGAASAERLADILADKGVSAIFATRTRRAMETAAPLASRLGLQVNAYNPADPAALAAAVAAAPGPVLVVGHSNTVPALVAQFGGAEPGPLSESDYGTLFIVAPDGKVTTRQVR